MFIRNLLNTLRSLFKHSNVTMPTNTLTHKKEKIQQILNVFETGSVQGDYAKVTIFADGPGNRRQITYGRSQTTEYGNLKRLLEMYVNEADAKYRTEFQPYISMIGSTPLVDNRAFIDLLRRAGADTIMHRVQDRFFDEVYWQPAVRWAEQNGFTKPLSMLVIYDSFIHSGSILQFLRRRFPAVPPANGGKEEDWITQYVDTRHSWLQNHSRVILRNTVYRTNAFKRAFQQNDWNLEKPFNANGVVVP